MDEGKGVALGCGVTVGVGLGGSVSVRVGVSLERGGGVWLDGDVMVGGALVSVGGGAVGRGARDSSQAVNKNTTLKTTI